MSFTWIISLYDKRLNVAMPRISEVISEQTLNHSLQIFVQFLILVNYLTLAIVQINEVN
jgi:hypothetical protein